MVVPSLTSQRLLLRSWQIEDAEALYSWCGDLKVTEFLFWYPHRDLEVSKRLLAKWVKKPRGFSWAITLNNQPIGEIQLIKDLPNGGGEIGYTLSSSYWGKGYMSEAFCLVKEYLTKQGYRYLYAESDSHNARSIAFLTKQGFKKKEEKPYHIDKKNEDIILSAFLLSLN